mgnify:CR=1 FL=1|tara:strand:- start:220 stop:552 length:333 start_codon:yes stop_codon:yes gene_type:complete
MNSKSYRNILEDLFLVLEDRKVNPTKNSYVTSLYEDGNNKINEKILEEAQEYIEAIKNNKKDSIIHEAADLWFHTLVSLALNDLTPNDILEELERRFGRSGIEEKASREK